MPLTRNENIPVCFITGISNVLLLKYLLLCLMTFSFFSCTNDIEKVNLLMNQETHPFINAKEVYMERNDSGKIIVKAYAPEFLYFSAYEEPYSEFPKGLKVETFQNYPDIESSITADYAINIEIKKLWKAQYNVVVTNNKGDTLNTELLYWDMMKHIIYTNKFCRVHTEDGILYGRNGFEADENFTKWKLFNTEGTVNVKDE